MEDKLTFEQECNLIANGEDLPEDKEMIEEMLNKLQKGEYCQKDCYGCCGDGKIDITCKTVVDNFQKELRKHYQPKCPEDSIVISVEEYNDLKHFKAKMNLPYHNISKEMANKIWYRAYQVALNTRGDITSQTIKELAKRDGVEVDEWNSL